MSTNPTKVNDRKWQCRGLLLAHVAATWSKDPKVQVGACVVSRDFKQISLGFNGLPNCISDDLLKTKSKVWKNRFVNHAEVNALYQARFNLFASTLFVTRMPCLTCAAKIIDFKVCQVVIDSRSLPKDKASSRWSNLVKANKLLRKAGVIVRYVNPEG